MRELEFTLVMAGNPEDDTTIDALFEAGCGDATFGTVDGVGYGRGCRVAAEVLPS